MNNNYKTNKTNTKLNSRYFTFVKLTKQWHF